MSDLTTYTVIAVYSDNHQRWAESFEAEDPDHAEEQAKDSASASGLTLIIAAVIVGDCEVVA